MKDGNRFTEVFSGIHSRIAFGESIMAPDDVGGHAVPFYVVVSYEHSCKANFETIKFFKFRNRQRS